MLNDRFIGSALRCPHCGADFDYAAGAPSLYCRGERRHCFDISSSGYLSLAGPKQSGGGDSKELISARSAFLEAGYFSGIADALCALASRYAAGGLVLDAGSGDGYYTLKIAAAAGCDICGFDLSKHGADAAARAAKASLRGSEGGGGGIAPAMFCVGGIFDLPVKDGSLDAIFNIFAPCAAEEFYRVLKPGGCLIVAGAGENHLMSLKAVLYDEPRKNTERNDLPKNMSQIEKTEVKYNMDIRKGDDVMALFSMTPYYYRTSCINGDKLKSLSRLIAEADVDIYVFRK